jgi:hypothetical protein
MRAKLCLSNIYAEVSAASLSNGDVASDRCLNSALCAPDRVSCLYLTGLRSSDLPEQVTLRM